MFTPFSMELANSADFCSKITDFIYGLLVYKSYYALDNTKQRS